MLRLQPWQVLDLTSILVFSFRSFSQTLFAIDLKITLLICERNLRKVAHQKLVIPAILKFEITPCQWSADRSGRLKCKPRPSFGAKFLEPWQVRTDFLRLDSNSDEVLKFLDHTGKFYDGSDALHPVSVESVQEWRILLHKLMLQEDFREWGRLLEGFSAKKVEGVFLESWFSLRFDWEKKPPEVLMSERTTLSAILATIHLDHARKARFSLCARPFCGAPFEPQSKHEKLYCTRECASAEDQRKRRDRRRIVAKTVGN